jgi:hypothetical protein
MLEFLLKHKGFSGGAYRTFCAPVSRWPERARGSQGSTGQVGSEAGSPRECLSSPKGQISGLWGPNFMGGAGSPPPTACPLNCIGHM